MSLLKNYLSSSFWSGMYEEGMKPYDSRAYISEPQGSVGMNTFSLPVYSNETSYVYMSHGQSSPNPYSAGIKTASLPVQNNFRACVETTSNPYMCQYGIDCRRN